MSFGCTVPLRLTLQVLDDAAEAVPVGGDDDVLSRLDYWGDDVIPERQSACNGVLQRLTRGELAGFEVFVAP